MSTRHRSREVRGAKVAAQYDIEVEAQRLNEAVARAMHASQEADLAAVGSLLREAAVAFEALAPEPPPALEFSGFRHYFPERPPQPNGEDLRLAEERWQAAAARGKRYRAEAQAQVGPLLTPAQTAARLGVSAVTISKWRRRGKLIGLRFDDHQYLYPVSQFADSPMQGERGVLRHLDQLLVALGDRSDWEKAMFLTAPHPALHSRSPIEMLLHSPSPDTLARLADLARRAGEMGQ